jgi:hypothetical protein
MDPTPPPRPHPTPRRQLLDDSSGAVAVAAARTLAALCCHARGVGSVDAAPLVGTLDRGPLNPVQGLVGEAGGVFGRLVAMQLGGSGGSSSGEDEADAAAAGAEALAALTRRHRANTRAHMMEVRGAASSGGERGKRRGKGVEG